MFSMESELLFLERVKEENRLMKQYRGRELFELLQNIDDAYNPDCHKECIAHIELRDNWLTVSNYGTQFTLDTLKRLCQGKVSGKSEKYIGCKGIGFRSVLNLGDTIEIFSGLITIRFSREYASRQLLEIDSSVHIRQQMDELRNLGLAPEYPIFKAPEYIEGRDSEYDTVIRIKVRDEALPSIKQDMDSFDSNTLLFLPNIKKIIFICDSMEKTIEKKTDGNDVTILSDGIQNQYHFKDKKSKIKMGNGKEGVMNLAVAIPMNTTAQAEYNLYTYFPILNQPCPFNAILNATFLLTDNRNELDISSEEMIETNSTVFESLLEFYVNTVIEVETGDNRLRLLTPKKFIKSDIGNFFRGNLEKLRKEQSYLDFCRNKEIFYTVNKEYRSAKEGQIIVIRDSPLCFSGEGFDSVVNIVHQDNRLYDFAVTLAENEYAYESLLLEAINKSSADWETYKRILSFKWWHIQQYNKLPKLLKNNENKFIESSDEPCFLFGSIAKIPSWARISVLAEDDTKEMIGLFKDEISGDSGKGKDSDLRILPRLIRDELINLQEQSSRTIMISPVNSSVDNDFNRALEFVEWLWDLWKENRFEENIRQIRFNLPSKMGGVWQSRQLYFGEDFHNDFGASLFRKLDGYYELYVPAGLKERASIDELREFFRGLGVKEYPRLNYIETKDIRGKDDAPMIWKFIDTLKVSHNIKVYVRHYDTYLFSIERIDDLLENLACLDVLRWIMKDGELLNHLRFGEYEKGNSYIEYKPAVQGQRYPVRYNDTWTLPSYLRFVFSNTEWIEINGKRSAPCNMIICSDRLLSDLGFNCITERDIDSWASLIGCDRNLLKELLTSIGVRMSYLDLSSEEFYGLLSSISGLRDEDMIEKSKKLSREIYRAIIDNGRSDSRKTLFYSDSDAKRKFFAEGKVLAKKRNRPAEYIPLANVRFCSSAVLDIDDNYFLDVPVRSGRGDDFKSILNVLYYEQNYKVQCYEKSECNDDFIKDYKSYLPCAMAYRQGKKDDVCNLSIELVKSITISCNGREVSDFDEYTLIRERKNHWLIYTGSEHSYSDIAKERLAECIEQVFNVFFNFPSKDFLSKVVQLFICTQRQREYFVKSDFGSIDELEESRKEIENSEELKLKLISRLQADLGGPLEEKDRALINEIDWNNVSECETQEQISKLLDNIHKDLEYLCTVVGRAVSLDRYRKKVRAGLLENFRDSFRKKVYGKLKEIPELQSSFFEILQKFDQDLSCYNNDASDLNGKEYMERLMDCERRIFGQYNLEWSENLPEVEYVSVFEQNKQQLVRTFSNASDYIDGFLRNTEEKSLLCFQIRRDAFVRYKDEQDKSESVSETDIPLDIQALVDNVEIEDDLKSGSNTWNNQAYCPSSGQTVSRREENAKMKRFQRQGDIAEYLVINKLLKREIKGINGLLGEDYSIKWMSGAALRNEYELNGEVETSGANDNVGYDIELKSRDGRRLFLEVKSSSSEECSFVISGNELKKAQEEGTSYRIVFVSSLNLKDLKNAKPKIHFIDKNLDNQDYFISIPLKMNVVYRG